MNQKPDQAIWRSLAIGKYLFQNKMKQPLHFLVKNLLGLLEKSWRTGMYLNTLFTVMGASILFTLLLKGPATLAQNLPNFTSVSGTQLTNTNGQWVTFNPAQPNNIDLLESRIFQMPAAGQGILGVEFKLVGGDGGTAHYQSGAYNTFANGGRGGEVNFTLNLQNTTHYDRPFLVTFGKKGESTTFGSGMYVSAGGGGSTGMAWLNPGGYNKDLNKRWGWDGGQLIAGAGGGGGGYADGYASFHGKNATRDGSASTTIVTDADIFLAQRMLMEDASEIYLVAGGSGLDMDNANPLVCCSNNFKMRQASSLSYNVFNYERGVMLWSGSVLQSVTQGQTGGKPIVLYSHQQNTPNTNNIGMGGLFYAPVMKSGGKGGSGMAGGGSGASTTTIFDFGVISFPSARNSIPTSGAGGTGSAAYVSYSHKNFEPGDDGYNDYSSYLQNVSISSRSNTNNPQSGYLMYRTIVDNVAPVVNNTTPIIITLNSNGTFPLTMQSMQPYIGAGIIADNDGIKYITFSQAQFTCNDKGQTVPVAITVYDFAGNSTSTVLYFTVLENATPTPVLPEPFPNWFDSDFPKRIDVTSGPVTLSAANFPQGLDGCNGSNGVTVHFPATTFHCWHAGTPQPVIYYYTDNDGNQSPNYTKTFIVSYSGSSTSRLYVDATATTGANTGVSWENAYTSLENALKCAGSEGREVYVAKGTYRPDGGSNDRNASFNIPTNYKIYGGFPNGGGDLIQRDPEVNPTILSGEIGTTAVNDNSYHVVSLSGSALLDGLVIRDGYSNGNEGGGLHIYQVGNLGTDSRIAIRNCKFLNNQALNGGAVFVAYQNSTSANYLDFNNCFFQNNSANSYGGALCTSWSPAVPNLQQSFVNCIFNNNSAARGGAINNETNSETTITNCTFAYNNATVRAGAVLDNGVLAMHNSILFFNTSPTNAQLHSYTSLKANYCNIQGSGGSSNWGLSSVQDMGNNIDADPLFHTSPALSLLPQSPSRNTGLNAYNNEPFDIGNNARISQNVIDMGAYELSEVVYVVADAPAGGDGSSWSRAFNNLNDGIATASILQKEVWVKEGTYRPDRIAGSNTPTPDNRDNTFYINSAAKIFGGFAGTETSRQQRNIGQHPTILSGDLGIAGNITDNTYHVITMVAGENHLEGLIIEGGNADHTTNIDKNRGGGIFEYNQSAGANDEITNCVFRNNRAVENGGAVYVKVDQTGLSTFSQCIFYNNTATRGAASFVKMNSAGAASYDQKFYNITALNNTAIAGTITGAFEAEEMTAAKPANITFYNSLLAGNNPQNYSDMTNPGHITLNHTYTAASSTGIFVNPSDIAGADGKIMTTDDGLQLILSSTAINFGDNTQVYNGTDKDIAGNQRIQQNIDAGAYESPYNISLIPDSNGIVYVKLNATGNGTGWDNPTGDLHNAIQAAGVQKVFVAAGTYKVGEHSFIMKNGVEIYGGFDPDNNITDLSHNRVMPDAIGTKGSILHGENVRPVIWNVFPITAQLNNTAVLDGFMITKGSYSNGAGMRNIYASPTLRNLVIAGNQATISGGGMYNSYSSPIVSNTLIGGNVVANNLPGAGIFGAGIMNINSSAPVFTNITVSTNLLIAPLGTAKGAGMYSIQATPQVYNSIFWYNQKNGSTTVPGSDIENDQAGYINLKNSITQLFTTGNTADNNKVGVSPQFENDYTLKINSPAIDAGSNALYTGLTANTKDLANNPRVYDFANNKPVDMGAYEYQCAPMDFSNVIFDDVTLAYNGNPHSTTAQNLPQGATVSYEITNAANQTTPGNTATNAGVYTINAILSATGASCTPVTKTAVLTINKIPAVITTAGVQSFVYDGAVKNVTATLDHTETILAYAPQQGYTDAGSYWVTVSAPETGNYLAASENVALVIENKDFTGIALNDAAFTYDGTSKSLAITGALPTDAILVYAGNEKTDIGIYPINALIQMPNYNDLWLSATMTITDPLPVRWISFDGKLDDDNHAKLNWKVDQTSVADYQIERSSNAKDFRIVGRVSATGDGTSQYSFTDPVAAVGTVYYRIRQTDLDGTYSYSRIISLTGPEGVQLMVYPNPTGGKVTVQVSPEYLGTWLKLINSSGILVKQVELKGQTLEIPLDNYPAGIYILYSWDGRAFKIIKN
jgi:predicted outer membrane repeat protein